MTKDYPEPMEKSTFIEYLKGFPIAHLATIDGNQPRVRAMALILHDGDLWISTTSSWNKVNQIKQNNRIELSIGIQGDRGTGAARVTGRAIDIGNRDLRHTLSEVIPWFNQYWDSPDSDSFSLFRIEIEQVLVDHPDNRVKYHVDW